MAWRGRCNWPLGASHLGSSVGTSFFFAFFIFGSFILRILSRLKILLAIIIVLFFPITVPTLRPTGVSVELYRVLLSNPVFFFYYGFH